MVSLEIHTECMFASSLGVSKSEVYKLPTSPLYDHLIQQFIFWIAKATYLERPICGVHSALHPTPH